MRIASIHIVCGIWNYRLGNDKYEQEGQCMSANNKIVVRSCNNCSNGQAIMSTLSFIEMHVTVEHVDRYTRCCTRKFYVEFI